MNEAETRVEGSRVRREYPVKPGRPKGAGERPPPRRKLFEGLAEKGFGRVFAGFQKYLYLAEAIA